MIADYSAEIKIAIFHSVWKQQRDVKDRPKIAGAWWQKSRVLTA